MKNTFLLSHIIWITLITACSGLATNSSTSPPAIDVKPLEAMETEALNYCKTKKLNPDFYLIIDLGRHSGLERFYVWDFAKHTITDSFLVSHGCYTSAWGSDQTKTNAVVSNTPDSHASSIGKYIIGERGYSQWGINIKYLLHGMDKTNSNAQKRIIVLHGWDQVSDAPVYPDGTPEGWGCPAVSNNAMRKLDALLKSSEKRVLMWVVR